MFVYELPKSIYLLKPKTMKPSTLFFVGATLLACFACENKNSQTTDMQSDSLVYPTTVKDSSVIDTYFGTRVSDPYRWLEQDTSAQTKAWVIAQNKVTFAYLDKIPYRKPLLDRLKALQNYPKFSSPFRLGEYYIFNKNDGLQDQSVCYIQKGLEGQPEVFFDPNTLSKDGTTRMNISSVSNDKKLITVNTGSAGSDWQTMEVMEVATKKKRADKLEWVKYGGAAWYQNGFFYSGYDKPAKGQELTAKNEYQKIYYHQLGTAQSSDQLVFEDKKHPLRYFGTQTTEDERFLILYVSEGTDGSEILYKDLKAGDKDFKLLFKGFDFNYSIIDNQQEQLLVYHNNGASNYKVSLVNPKTKVMIDFIAEKPDKLESVGTAGGKLFASYLKDVATHTYQHDIATGKLDREIAFPGIGTAYGFNGNKDDKTIFYSFESYTYPESIFRYEMASGKSSDFQKPSVQFNPGDFESKQVFYPSRDGTKIPLFITFKKGTAFDGTAPTILYAYGGFNVSIAPSFSPTNIAFMEQGGIYAVACLRGGGEYGEQWHKAGMLLKKQNVFDDFIAAADYLTKEKYTSKARLAILGGSNGGLLVGAVMCQKPDLCQVAFPAVGVMDMLRYHKFTVGWGWTVEYGSSEQSKESFQNLYAYSPLHNLKDGTNYPATMVLTADHDDRVVPAHSFKFIATLQEKHQGKNPVLIRIETNSGHGSSNLSKRLEETADIYAFMWANMGVIPKY